MARSKQRDILLSAPHDERPRVLMGGRLIVFADALAELATDFSSWNDRFPAAEPRYALPEAVIARMAIHRPGLGPVLDPDSARAEQRFTRLCVLAGGVGNWGGWAINYSWLFAPIPPPTAQQMAWIGATANDFARACRLIRIVGRYRRSVVGYVGWVLTDPVYLAARDALRVRWRSFPPILRPEFPLTGLTGVGCNLIPDANLAADRSGLGRFVGDLTVFLERWELIGLATWDLPLPRGPHLSDSAPGQSGGGLHVVLPNWFPIDAGDGVTADLRRIRKPAAAPLTHAGIHATMFSVDYLERAMADRAPDPTRLPRGWVGLVVDALADALGISTDHARAIRKAISACRRGHRDTAAIFHRRPRP